VKRAQPKLPVIGKPCYIQWKDASSNFKQEWTDYTQKLILMETIGFLKELNEEYVSVIMTRAVKDDDMFTGDITVPVSSIVEIKEIKV
jgi:hypothetical protein